MITVLLVLGYLAVGIAAGYVVRRAMDEPEWDDPSTLGAVVLMWPGIVIIAVFLLAFFVVGTALEALGSLVPGRKRGR